MSIDPEHEKAYSPSSWSKRFSSTEILPYFLQFAQKVTDKARSAVSCELDIPYGIGDRAKYDIYGNNLPSDAPIFIFIHGGYWQEFSKDLAGFFVESLVSKGIKVVNVGYSLCPSVTLTDIVTQVKSAITKILKRARDIGSKSVWIAGHSAGAHLAASLLHDDEFLDSIKEDNCYELLKGFLLIAGIYKLEPLLRTSYNDALKLTSDEVKRFSLGSTGNLRNKHIDEIKVMVTVGECDAPIFIEESKHYAQKLIEFVDNVEFMLLRNDIDHFDIVENLTISNFVLTELIVENVNAHLHL